MNETRTLIQNRAIHKLFELVAGELNDAGYTVKAVLEKNDIDVNWDAKLVKSILWKRIMQVQLKKGKTRNLTTKEVDEVYETFNRFLGEKLFLHIPFPSEEFRNYEEN